MSLITVTIGGLIPLLAAAEVARRAALGRRLGQSMIRAETKQYEERDRRS